MNESNKTIRLNKVLRELNLSLDQAVNYLGSKGYDIEAKPATKISNDVYKMLLDGFEEIGRTQSDLMKIHRSRRSYKTIKREPIREMTALKNSNQIQKKNHPINITRILEKFNIDKKLLFIDESFSFINPEKEEFTELYSDYSKNLNDIEGLIKKENRFWALETEEIVVLIESKLKIIYDIQKEIKEERDFKRLTNDSNDSSHDPYEGFYWGGLSGEEAHTAYWNCD